MKISKCFAKNLLMILIVIVPIFFISIFLDIIFSKENKENKETQEKSIETLQKEKLKLEILKLQNETINRKTTN